MALHSIAAPQVTSAKDRIQVRRTRSANTPNGSEKTAATSAVTVTSSPMSVLLIPSARRSSTADAPTVAVSALASASTQAIRTTTRVRAGPPTATTSRLRAAAPPRRSVPVPRASILRRDCAGDAVRRPPRRRYRTRRSFACPQYSGSPVLP